MPRVRGRGWILLHRASSRRGRPVGLSFHFSNCKCFKHVVTLVVFYLCGLDLIFFWIKFGPFNNLFISTFDCRTRSSNYSKLEKYVGEKVSSRSRNSILIKEIHKLYSFIKNWGAYFGTFLIPNLFLSLPFRTWVKGDDAEYPNFYHYLFKGDKCEYFFLPLNVL